MLTTGALSFESSGTPTRMGTVSINCSVCCRSNDDQNSLQT